MLISNVMISTGVVKMEHAWLKEVISKNCTIGNNYPTFTVRSSNVEKEFDEIVSDVMTWLEACKHYLFISQL